MDWYILNDDGHQGPYAEEQLHSLYRDGKILEKQLIWTEGMQAALPYSSILDKKNSELEHLIEVPPPVPIEVRAPTKFLSDTKERKIKKIKKVRQKKSNFLKYFSLFLIAVLFLGAGFFAYKFIEKMTFSRPAKMAMYDYKKLKSLSLKKGEQLFSTAISKDKSTLWIATNSPYEGKVRIEVSSIENKVLSNEKIIFQATGLLENKLATFSVFEFKEGIKIEDGEYEVTFKTFYPLKKKIWKDFDSKFSPTFDLKSKFLITIIGKDDFYKTLKKFQKKVVSNNTDFWDELSQKYQTLKMISMQIREGIEEVFLFQKLSFKKHIENFEGKYKQKYGPFFTSFVVANEKSYDQLKDKDFSDKVNIISNYVRLSKIARSIGKVTMKSLDDMRQFQFLRSRKKVDQLKRSIISQFDKIINLCDENMTLIEKNNSGS